MALVPLPATFDSPPPHDVQAERAVLGSILIAREAFDRVAPIVGAGDFFRHEHQIVFRAMAAMSEAGDPIDLLTLRAALSPDGLKKIGGAAYLSGLLDGIPDAANVEKYAVIVREHALRRRIMTVGHDLIRDAFSAADHPHAIVTGAEQQILEIAGRGEHAGLQPASRLMREAIGYAEVQQCGARTGDGPDHRLHGALRPHRRPAAA